ncbi:MAG: glycoside hydrolase family 13 protein [Ruminococcaceae bacterium]|nr:glycoside hydrolase family 13 protein [Oscillospiraceae bacterium]
MLVKLTSELLADAEIKLEKTTKKGNASLCGAFPQSEKLFFKVSAPRVWGVRDVVLRLSRDGEGDRDFPFVSEGLGEFSLELSLSRLGEGLYWYTVLFLRGEDTLFAQTSDNVHFRLLTNEGNRFRLLVYEDGFTTPEWFRGGTMYQIFPDRFARSGKSEKRSDAEYCDDWYAPISQYGNVPGADVKNDLFYGGDIYGVVQKLDYLSSLGVTVLYLNPVFEAYSNHKYDTGDYTNVDSAFGGNEALELLISEAAKRGMRVILDGVFNHTGDDSIYFDRYRRYGSDGAYKNPDSPYRGWYHFGRSEEDYLSWWGIKILPKLNHKDESCRSYFTAQDGIGARYVKKGTGGWRLDVADELSDDFLDEFRASVKAADPEAVIIGEVWENAADKIAYGKRRRYFRGRQLDSVMNYPFRTACINFIKTKNGRALAETLTEIYASYPKCCADSLMNILGTHDTERILTVLGDGSYQAMSNHSLSTHTMMENERYKGKRLLKAASTIQYTVYGVPSLYYGDEAGVEGGRDPFCRKTYPWGKEDKELLEHYKRLGALRRDPVFAEGSFEVKDSGVGYIIYERCLAERRITVISNVSGMDIETDVRGRDMITGEPFLGTVPALTTVVVE